ncbi:MAG: mucoidy inhibitor MuiA family protein, partial [Marinosulfonomonas sp.]|nr:mucoidy inhibitor MuiA family protein [Marinosulfonomonas sp.]
MRSLIAFVLFAVFAIPAMAPVMAKDILAPLNPAAATIYPRGASVTYFADLDLPQGSHRVLLPYADNAYDFNPPRLKVSEGVRVGAVNYLDNITYDQDALLTKNQAVAKAALEKAEDALKAKEAQINSVKQGLAALDMQATFLGSISGSEVENPDVEQMRAMSQMILNEAEGAISKRLEIERQLEVLKEELADLNDAMAEADRLFMRLSPPSGEGNMLVISVEVASPVTARFQVEQIIPSAGWAVAYDFRLTYGDAPALEVERKVLVSQDTGQAWPDIDLTLSTASPLSQSAPSAVGGNLATVYQAAKDRGFAETRLSAAPMVEEEVMMAKEPPITAGLVVEGLSLTYVYPRKVTLADGEQVQLTLDAFSLPVETSLLAIPRVDATAFVMAEITNDRDEPLLSGEVSYYRDGSFIGRGAITMLAAGGKVDLPFGAMEGIRLTYTNLRRETGDTGIITTSSTREDIVEFSVENLTGESQ